MSVAASGTAGRIVLVDDDVEFLDELSDYLSRSGFIVSAWHRPTLAGRFLRFVQPEAVLLDFDMPGVSGLQILQQLRARSETRSIPVLLLTAHDHPEIRAGGWSHQLDDFIPKGTDRAEIRMRLTRAVERFRENRIHEHATGLPAGPTGRAQLSAALTAAFAHDATPGSNADDEALAGEQVDVDQAGAVRSVFVLRFFGFELFQRGDRPELVDGYRRCFRALAHRLRDVLDLTAIACEAGPDCVIYCAPAARPAGVLQLAVLRRRSIGRVLFYRAARTRLGRIPAR